MKSAEEVKRIVESFDVVCPECGKRPQKSFCTTMDGGYVKNEMACCHGKGAVTIHVETGRVVDATYANASKAGVAAAYIPLAFVASARSDGPVTRTTGWLKEKLPMAACAHSAQEKSGFWGWLRQCVSNLWH